MDAGDGLQAAVGGGVGLFQQGDAQLRVLHQQVFQAVKVGRGAVQQFEQLQLSGMVALAVATGLGLDFGAGVEVALKQGKTQRLALVEGVQSLDLFRQQLQIVPLIEFDAGFIQRLQHIDLDDIRQLQQRAGSLCEHEVVQGQPVAQLAQLMQTLDQLLVDGDRLQHFDNQLLAAGRQQFGVQQPVPGGIEEQRALADQTLQTYFKERGIARAHRRRQATVDQRLIALRVMTIKQLIAHMLPLRIAYGL